MYYFWVKINLNKKNEEKRPGHLAEPALSSRPCSPSRGLSPLRCGRPEVPPPPPPPGLRRPGWPRDWHPCGAPCLFRAGRAQSGPLPAVFRQGCERRLLSPFYT